MSIKYMGSLLLLAWPMLGFSELPQKSSTMKNFSVEHKPTSSKMKKNNLLVTKRQLHKKQVIRKEQIAQKKITETKKISASVMKTSKTNSTQQRVKAAKKQIDPKYYSKQCKQLYDHQDFTQAVLACQKAAEHNDSQAALRLAKIYSIGTASSSPDYTKAHSYATISANLNNPEAQFLLALCYENGIGVAQDKAAAFNWYQQAAQNGLAGARIIEDSAWAWSSAAGHPVAEYQLAMEYLQGENTTQDDAKALNLFTQSADKGYAPAQTYLAWMNLLGLGTTPNTEQAIQQFLDAKQILTLDESDSRVKTKLAALTSITPLTKKQPLAELQRGIDLLEMSTGGKAEGLAIITKAAEDNSIKAQLYLAQLYQQGEKVPAQAEVATQWYQRAANSNNTEALYALGWLYYYGQGVPKNTQQALACFAKASLMGDIRSEQATSFIQAQVVPQSIKVASTENLLRPTIASKVKEKVTDNINGIFKAMGFSGFAKKS